jgi:hypothetical protein
MKLQLFVIGCACLLALGLSACGGSSKSGGGGAAGAAGTGAAGTGAGTHTCAELATCCTGTTFTAAAAKPGAQIRLSQCQMVATGGNEAGCSALYNGYLGLSACP